MCIERRQTLVFKTIYHLFLTLYHTFPMFNDLENKTSENIVEKGENAGNHFVKYLRVQNKSRLDD